MVSLTRIYTGGGDRGETSLGDGSRRSKCDPRLIAMGEVDEANCALGLALVSLRTQVNLSVHIEIAAIAQIIAQCQNQIFDLGADLAVPIAKDEISKSKLKKLLNEVKNPEQKSRLRITKNYWQLLESAMDKLNETLPPLDSFIMPGGGSGDRAEAVARLHLARAITRRAERAVITLAQVEKINPEIIIYLNRLSDFLFVAARAVAKSDPSGQSEIKWIPGK